MKYRPELDGLRAIAVVSVILYHAKFTVAGTTLFQGGYVGVDVFFVISGYLICKLLILEYQQNGTLSFGSYYLRRARRILPMLMTVILCSLPFAWSALLPVPFMEYARSGLAAIFFGSNIYFYFATTEYGAESSLLKPLLHTWSLGVEEQYYLIFPALLMLCLRLSSRLFLPVLAVLLFGSLYLSESLGSFHPDLAFYLPFTRWWEIISGSILAVLTISEPRLI